MRERPTRNPAEARLPQNWLRQEVPDHGVTLFVSPALASRLGAHSEIADIGIFKWLVEFYMAHQMFLRTEGRAPYFQVEQFAAALEHQPIHYLTVDFKSFYIDAKPVLPY